MANRGSRSEKVKRIFKQFDVNSDGGLNREEMAALMVAVNPRFKFSEPILSAILDEVFRRYEGFVDDEKGLTLDGLLHTYDDGARDVDRDFHGLGLELKPVEDENGISQASQEEGSPSSFLDERVVESHRAQRTTDQSIVFDSTWKLVDDLEVLIRRLRAKPAKDGKIKNDNSDEFSNPKELDLSGELSKKVVIGDESGPDYALFVKQLVALRLRADRSHTGDEAFEGQMAIGHVLYEHCLFKEALVSFKRACELRPSDVKPHFRAGNCLYALGRRSEAKGEFLLALEVAKAGREQWAYLLPQIHVNLGIVLEHEGMVLSACQHYREAAMLCPTHFRALKLWGSALFGVGEYKAAVMALEEAIHMKNDYADAHCDLASALRAMGDHENAIKEFQKAIDLKPDHVDALYNLGGLYIDMGRYRRATEVYIRVLGVWPNHWGAQLNKAVSLIGAGEAGEAKKALKEALKMTNRVEVHDAISHLKQLQKKKLRGNGNGNGNGNGEEDFITVEPMKFKIVGEKTTSRPELAIALDIRAFQKVTKLNQCQVELIKKEMIEGDVPATGSGVPEKSTPKASLEGILRKLLNFLKLEAFVGAIKAINQKILCVLDESESGQVDLGMLFAVLAPICGGSADKRKQVAYESLLWRPGNEGNTQITKSDAQRYVKLLRTIYIPSHGISEVLEIHEEADNSLVSLTEFTTMFDDPEWGFSIISTVLKLEAGDRIRHGSHVCATCRYPITGSRFKEMNSHFSLCSQCYSEGKVPSSCKQEEYRFKEYAKEAEAVKDKFSWFGSKGSVSGHLHII